MSLFFRFMCFCTAMIRW